MSMVELLDAIRNMLEPPDALDESLGEGGTHRDLTCALPFEFEPDTLYVIEDEDAEQPSETNTEAGVAYRRNFAITAIYVAVNDGENANARRSRDVSIALDERREAYFRRIRAHRSAALWDHIQGTADADYLRQLQVRGIAVRITGYRFAS